MSESNPHPSPKEQLTLKMNILEAEREELKTLLDNDSVPAPEKIQEVTMYVIHFFQTIESLKGLMGNSALDAEEGKITKIDDGAYTEFAENVNFIKKTRLPYIENKPEKGEPIEKSILETIKSKLLEAELIITGLK
jgi:hypothetical protein